MQKFFFQREKAGVLFAFVVLRGVSGAVFAVFGCASMLVSVTFYVGMRGDWVC